MSSHERSRYKLLLSILDNRVRNLKPHYLFITVLCAPLLGADRGGCAAPQRVGSSTCLACHDGRTAVDQRAFVEGPHRAISCEDCHGPGGAHVRNVEFGSGFIENPARLPLPESVELCGKCHAAEHAGFLESAHASRGLSCYDCHDVHQPGGMLEASPNSVRLSQVGFARSCGECHAEEVGGYASSNHSALPELTCGICHNLHAATPFTADPIANDLCLQCHQSRALGFVSDAEVHAHTGPFHPVDPAGSGASRCVSCHLPPVGVQSSVHDHSLATVPPQSTIDAILERGIAVPNSCAGVAGCHDAAHPGSGAPHDVESVEENIVLQTLYEMIGVAPDTSDVRGSAKHAQEN